MYNYPMLSTIWNNLESIIALLTIAVSAYIFLNDPIRRWRFFGYRPTALIVLIDPKIKQLVIVNSSGSWSFSQGGIYGSDVYDAVEDILKRELNLNPADYKLFYTKAVGKADLSKEWQKNYPVFGGLKFSSEIKGKSYIACYVMVDLKDIKEPGYGITEIKFVSKDEAIKIFNDNVSNKSKKEILNKCLNESDKAIDLWERTNRL